MKIKIFVGIAFGLFVIIVASISFAGFVLYGQKKEANTKLASLDPSISNQLPANQTDPSVGGLTVDDVAKHASQVDCWMVIDGNIYNLTKFLSSHPGGAGVIIPYCGRDGSSAFAGKDLTPAKPHSAVAKELLNQYFLAKLGSTVALISGVPVVNLPTASPTTKVVIPTTPPANINPPSTSTLLTTSEIARHSGSGDCWIIISGYVYNVTGFLFEHPGGSGTIIPYCGRDATNAFATKDRSPGSAHSAVAQNMLNSYLVGKVGSAIASANPGSNTTGVNSAPIPTTPAGSSGTTSGSTSGAGSSGSSAGSGSPGSTSLTLTTAQVSAHNTLQNCWLIVSGKVYDVTSYISRHPGGQSAILRHCGTESTTAFQTRDGSGSHSQTAYNLLGGYLIGNLNDTIVVTPPSSTNPSPTIVPGGASPTPTRRPRREEDDD